MQIAPAVSTQPVSGTICAGSNRTFSVSASGSALNYQWEVSTDGGNTFNPIGSANANSYTVSAATITQNNYRYRCVVSGACTPAVTSNAATLNVFNAVAISNQPADITICSNSNTNFYCCSNRICLLVTNGRKVQMADLLTIILEEQLMQHFRLQQLQADKQVTATVV
ncbi:MAG: hypothetical protein IPK31_03805 [Chitinophagaceae bacterium]|nr:hypothetical protein [Chitinophagaceae bacterium]